MVVEDSAPPGDYGYNGMQGGEEMVCHMAYPERPGETECQYYMKTGTCKYASKCKFHHPPDVTPLWGAVTPATDVTVGLNSESYPRRPGEQQCTFFLKTGTCKYKMSCKFDHPPEAIQQTLQLQSTPYPVRPGELQCTYYLKTGKCKFGATCRFDHPPMSPEQAAAAAAAANGYPPQPGMPPPGADVRGMGTMGMGPMPRGPQGGVIYYSPHDPSMMGLMPATGPMGYGVAPSMSLPQRPGEKECTFFLRTGRCQYAARCRFHHPLDKMTALVGPMHAGPHAMGLVPAHPHALQAAHHAHGMAPAAFVAGQHAHHGMDPSTAAAYGYAHAPPPMPLPPMRGASSQSAGGAGGGSDSGLLPSRPSTEACSYFMRTGKCSYGMSCRFDHPRSNSRETSGESGVTNGSGGSSQGANSVNPAADGQGGGYAMNGQTGGYPGAAMAAGYGAGADAYGAPAGFMGYHHQYPGQAAPVYASYRQAS